MLGTINREESGGVAGSAAAKQNSKISGHRWAIGILTLCVLLSIYVLRLDPVVGQFKDDAWYVILAKSLATGHGYNLISYPRHSGLYFYPPFFPLLLSLLYRIQPHFPENVFLLKSLSIAAALIAASLVYRLFRRDERLPEWLPYMLAFATAAAPSVVMLATSCVMSECTFMALQFATLLAAEKCGQKGSDGSTLGIAAGCGGLAGLSYLTRSIGVDLVAATAIYLLLRRHFRQFVVFCVAAIACISPWLMYKHIRIAHSSPAEVAEGYSDQFWDRLAGSHVKVTVRDLPPRAWQISTAIVGDAVGALLAPSGYTFPAESGEELIEMTSTIRSVSRNYIETGTGSMGLAVADQLISLGFSLVILVGFISAVRSGDRLLEIFLVLSLINIALWPWPPIRFLVPLLPLLLYYLVLGVAQIHQFVLRVLARPLPKNDWTVARIVLICIAVFFVYHNALYIAARHQNLASVAHPDWVRRFYATKEAATWIREHTKPAEVVTGDNLAMLYLYSDRETDDCDFNVCLKRGIRFFMRTRDDTDVPPSATTVFRTGYHAVEVVDLAAGREPKADLTP